VESNRGRRKVAARRVRLVEPGVVEFVPDAISLPVDLRRAIVLFFSVLDEKQRYFYAELEAFKGGHCGNRRIAKLLGLNVGTVARGRRELLGRDIEVKRVRKAGGGRKSVKKTPQVIARIQTLMAYETAGDPMTGLK